MPIFKRQSTDTTDPRAARSGSLPQDPALALKRRARHRLLGVTTLVMTSIIVLPMIFDSEPKPRTREIAITIPSKTVPASNQRLANERPLSEEANPAPATSKETPQPIGLPSADSTENTVNKSVDNPVNSTLNNAVNKPAKAAVEASAKAVESSASVAQKEKAAVDATRESSQQARAQALLEGKGASPAAEAVKPQDRKPESGGERYWLQIGAFANQEKVDQLLTKLRGSGFHPQTAVLETSGGPRTRVRLGPFSSKAAAEAAQKRLQPLALNAALVIEK
ncbi:SPOR domain-containing protein [Parvibium lacunae]|uniref:SPOR domain-containing protein n=1 Tax=Parvibium lacunae TaxID=1888893 RepID=A0A368L396_9BURK|nr:SPOR domain-containing protein [Parvibium lacunae]RCS58058.1 SPOR domain-containing protein [Parvibium lacunae]